MDWGLLSKDAGENKFLREQIVYEYKVKGKSKVLFFYYSENLSQNTTLGTILFYSAVSWIYCIILCINIFLRVGTKFCEALDKEVVSLLVVKCLRNILLVPEVICFYERYGKGINKKYGSP